MQPQGQTVEESAAAFDGLGDELLTVLPVLFFLALGYVAARVCRAAHSSFAPKAAFKTIKTMDDSEEPCTDVITVCEEMVSETSCSKPSSRLSNAQVRKHMRKTSRTNSEKVEKVALEVPPCHHPEPCLESSPMVKETASSSQEASPANERTVKLMMKKAERKARKAAEQKVVELSVKHESPSAGDTNEKIVSEVSLQIDDTMANQSLSMSSPTLCGQSPSMLSSKSTLCESSASLTCTTPDSARSKSIDISECSTIEDLADSCHPAADQQSSRTDESDALQEAAGPVEDEMPGSIGGSAVCSNLAHIHFDDIESDTDSDDEFEQQVASVYREDASQSYPDMTNTPVMWCNPGTMDDSMQIEGWMPVAVPMECAPGGAFDGLWKNCADEKILIEKLEIMFESGVSWDMDMQSATNLSVTLKDQTFCAELDASGQKLLWSDGDVWTFHGLPQSSTEQVAPDAPCMVMQEMMMPMLASPEEMQMLPTDCFQPEQMMMHFPVSEEMQVLPTMQCMPANGEQWEVCWDWQKKGRCPRGSSCEWYHPEPGASFF